MMGNRAHKGTPMRPNNNVFLNVMRDGDTEDMFDLTMAYGFALCDMMHYKDLDNLIPDSMGYWPGLGGPDTEAFEWFEVNSQFAWLRDMYGADRAVKEAIFALKCIDRLIDWLKDAGKAY